MKIRNSFVSNSSSSSFVLITSIKNHNKALEEFDEKERKMIGYLMEKSTRKLFGRDIVVGEDISTENYSTLYNEDIPEEYHDDIFDVWCKYRNLVEKNVEETFSYSCDF